MPKSDDPAQSMRFIDMAHEVEAVDDLEGFDRAFTKIAPPPPDRAPEKT